MYSWQMLLNFVSGHRGATMGKPSLLSAYRVTGPHRVGAMCMVAQGLIRRREHGL